MTKNLSILFFCIAIGLVSRAQQNLSSYKAAITPAVFGKFNTVSRASISNDGKYALYYINNPSTQSFSAWLRELNSEWTSDLGPTIYQFSDDSRYIIGKNNHDSLILFDLSSRQTSFVRDVSSFKLKDKFLAYQLKLTNTLRLQNLKTQSINSFDSVSSYAFDRAGCLLFTRLKNGFPSVVSINFLENKKSVLWEAQNDNAHADNFIFSDDGLAFTTKTGKYLEVWYSNGINKAEKIVDGGSFQDSALLIGGIDFRGFTNDGKKLFVRFLEKPRRQSDKGVDVWSYTDSKLQSQQQVELKPQTFSGIFDITSKNLIVLENKDEKIIAYNNEFAIAANLQTTSVYDEWYWNKKGGSLVYLVSLQDGKRKSISENIPGMIASGSYRLSPSGKFVVYYDGQQRSFFSYETATGIKRNVTRGCTGIWSTYTKRDVPIAPYMLLNPSIAAWEKDDKVLLYDQCDIYEVDPSGKHRPINLTNGYGKKHNIEFRLAVENDPTFSGDEQIILSAFNRNTKDDGFYRMKLGEQKTPELLTVQPCIFKGTWEYDGNAIPIAPEKAKYANVYLVRSMSAEESPNYFWTTDFKTYHSITNIHPEKNYNWLTTELINWTLPDGSTSQGILYKPENFDASKKYPLLFTYYENSTEGLHEFLQPEFTMGTLNIPYYVSNGYLVFTPDIHYKIGHPGQSVVNTMVSAANYLGKRPYVDAKHMGIQGHSRGGWETNFILTHTNLFAAAMSSSGFCDYVALYNGARLLKAGISRQTTYEKVYQRIGTSLWDRPDLYIENSSVFKVDKVTTPVLMMNNKEDNDVPFEQGIEFFTALRRLGERAWMLQYDGQGHLVTSDMATEDLEIRMKQFFDHYLKDSACPRWMLYGVPASEKGNPDALKLVYEKDPKTGKWLTPKEGGLLTDEEKKKVEALKHRKPVTVTLE